MRFFEFFFSFCSVIQINEYGFSYRYICLVVVGLCRRHPDRFFLLLIENLCFYIWLQFRFLYRILFFFIFVSLCSESFAVYLLLIGILLCFLSIIVWNWKNEMGFAVQIFSSNFFLECFSFNLFSTSAQLHIRCILINYLDTNESEFWSRIR